MELPNKDKIQRHKVPRVPIQTYKWEDVKRSRLRGEYPWTYLSKDPFDEEVDPEDFTMEAMRKSKSSSTLGGKSSPGIEIQEIRNGVESQETLTVESGGYIVITEVPSDSDLNNSTDVPRGSLTIVEEPEVLNFELSESSDNVSQYLDKDEVMVEAAGTNEKSDKDEAMVEAAGTSKNTSDTDRQERAKSEEPKRKRKLSIDSSYSRISLSKLGFLKKLKEAKEKIKVPKLSLPMLHKEDSQKKTQEKVETVEEEPKTEKKEKKQNISPKNEKPVYIHIPLKPPEGQTDEFSYLEFEEKSKPAKEVKEKEEKEEQKEETKPEESVKPESPVEPKQTLQEPPDNTQRRYSENPDEIVAFEILKTQSIDLDEASQNGLSVGPDGEIYIMNQDQTNADDVIIFMPKNEDSISKKSETRGSQKSLNRQGSSRKARAKSAEPERKRKLSIESSNSRRSLSKLGIMKKLKEAKDKIRFPSLAKLSSKKEKNKVVKEDTVVSDTKKKPDAIKSEIKRMEKPEGSEPKYIHIPLKPPPGTTDKFSYLEFEENQNNKVTETPKETAEKSNKREPIKEEQSSIESPGSAQNDGVHFIFLTPPSDDEILDHPDIPETPSSDQKTFFATRIGELKELAKDAVDEAAAGKGKRALEAVEEESGHKVEPGEIKEARETEEVKVEAAENKQTTEEEKVEKLVIDEEDGLKLTESAMAKQEQNIKSKDAPEEPQQSEEKLAEEIAKELKSSLKNETASPLLKKKVSFKRRSRDDSKHGIYEDVQVPKEKVINVTDEQKTKLAVLGDSQSMSVDEEKSYLDEKIIKSTSLEEDYNRWSKLSDHEYEPVNPPPDNISPTTGLPKVRVTDTEQGSQPKTLSLASSTTSMERRMLGSDPDNHEESFTVEEMQTQIEDRFFTKVPERASFHLKGTLVPEEEPEIVLQNEPPKPTPGRFQQAFKAQTDKFKNKLHGIKRPNIKLPSKPKFEKPNLQRFKIDKSKFNLPKIPDTARINLPTFSLTRTSQTKRTLKERQLSTESNAGDSKKKIFDFSTYPRIFKKKPKDDLDSLGSKNEPGVTEFATVPRTKRNNNKQGESIRISLHAEDSLEDDNKNVEPEEVEEERESSLERRMASHIRYDQDIDIDDEYEKENQEIHRASPFSHDYNNRWNHGSFHAEPTLEFAENFRNRQVTDLDSPEDGPPAHESFDNSKDINSSESSLGIHRKGVLEEIDSDEFFLRQKGISQDNIEVGRYLSSEIRDALKSPNNALSDLQMDTYDTRASNQSLPEVQSTKRKAIKKPKRKKTPHVSQEQISFDQDSEQEFSSSPPVRPKRRSKRSKKPKEPGLNEDEIIPYQETIADDTNNGPSILLRHMEDDSVHYRSMYENEQMEGKDQPEIHITDPYADFNYESDEEVFPTEETHKPSAPPRKHRSLKSLNYSEHDSILGDSREIPQELEVYKHEHEYIIPSADQPPPKPARSLSQNSQSEIIQETPVRPARTRSRSGTRSRADSVDSGQECIEETCVQDFRDYMGYAVIDKNLKREPPLPPPRTPPRRKKSIKSSEASVSEPKFFTVPRQLNDQPPPTRPVRNYSTLGPSRPPRRKPPPNMTDEEKQTVDLTQYIEIDDESNRDLHSGEVIQKMRDRPLPAPPRPPREKRPKSIQDEDETHEDDVSIQTDLLPDNLVHEEDNREESDVLLSPTDEITIERRLITPTHYSYNEEIITHGTLIVEPLNGARILPDSQMTHAPVQYTIPINQDSDNDETSEIPEDFKKLKDPTRPEIEVLKAQKLKVSDLDVNRLSVNELLASKIIVSEIDSGSILTSEIGSKSGTLRVGEFELPPGVVQQLFERLQVVAQEQQSSGPKEDTDAEQKKTPIEQMTDETLQPRPSTQIAETRIIIDNKPTQTDSLTVEYEEITEVRDAVMDPPEPPVRSDSSHKVQHLQEQDASLKNLEEQIIEELIETVEEVLGEPPQRPPRQSDKLKTDESDANLDNKEDVKTFEAPDIDDEPPPRPPQPDLDYLPSQPPPSFYALRAQQYVEDVEGDIPSIPRRRRHHKPPVSRSSSEEFPHPAPVRRRVRSPEPTIPQLTGQLIQACGSAANNTFKRLITHITNNVLRNADGQQDLHVMIVMLLVLIAGLILLGWGDGKTVHHHHWEYFNPPRDL